VKVFLGLGSNLGDSRQIVLDAVKALGEFLTDTRRASLYQTKPLYVADQGSFINTVVEGFYTLIDASSPTAGAVELLSRIHEIEGRFGRDRSKERRWGERFLDIDILLFGDFTINVNETELTIPHPRLKERRFALEPLIELAPDVAEPCTGLFYRDFCAALPDQGVSVINFTDFIIDFNPAAFDHDVSEVDIYRAFDTAIYDGLLDEPNDDDAREKYLLIGFDSNANPLEVLYNFISDYHVNVFHAMPCRSIYNHLLKPKE